jgi:hypothetical protein
MSDLRQGVTEAGHAVLDLVDRERKPFVAHEALARQASIHAGLALSGDLSSRRAAAIRAAAMAILAIEAIEKELRG